MAWYEKIKDFSDAIVKLDEKIGFKKLFLYTCLILVVIGVFNFKSVVKSGIELFTEIGEEIHVEKMEKRDQLLVELLPMLGKYRTFSGADRILFFEYHNSKENLVGIPFKYVDLVLQDTRYGIPATPLANFTDINVGTITNLYEDLKTGNIIHCYGPEDSVFIQKYPTNFEYMQKGDGSLQQVYISVPGVNQPIGMIILEWMDTTYNVDIEKIREESHDINSYIGRISGLILSKR